MCHNFPELKIYEGFLLINSKILISGEKTEWEDEIFKDFVYLTPGHTPGCPMWPQSRKQS